MMAQEVKALPTNVDDLDSIPRTYVSEGENHLLSKCLLIYIHEL